MFVNVNAPVGGRSERKSGSIVTRSLIVCFLFLTWF